MEARSGRRKNSISLGGSRASFLALIVPVLLQTFQNLTAAHDFLPDISPQDAVLYEQHAILDLHREFYHIRRPACACR